MTEFHIACSCGRRMSVTAAHAGSSRRCPCGSEVAVPRLSELRRNAGRPPYATSVIDRINERRRTGALPAGQSCAVCQLFTTATLTCFVECERTFSVGQYPFWQQVLMFLVSPLLWRVMQAAEETEVHGRERTVETPLTVCEDCRPRLCRSRTELRAALYTVPEYAELLKEYPDATLNTGEWIRR